MAAGLLCRVMRKGIMWLNEGGSNSTVSECLPVTLILSYLHMIDID